MTKKLKSFKDELINNINQASQVFIVGHNTPDYDAIGAAIGIAVLTKALKKPAYIIVNEPKSALDQGVQTIIEETETTYNYINLEEFRNYVDKNSLLITVDVNKQYMTCVKDDLDKFDKIMIIDHHQEEPDTTIQTKNKNKYINENTSSASEIVTQILNSKQIRYSKEIAKYLLAGIVLDTNRFQKNTTATTFDTTKKLLSKGADYKAVNKLFISNFVEDRVTYTLIFGRKEVLQEHVSTEAGIAPQSVFVEDNTFIEAYSQVIGQPTVSFTIKRDQPDMLYRQDELAKTADKMMQKYADASFVLGYVSETDVGISARSKCQINVGKIMSLLEKASFTINPNLPASSPVIRSGGGNKTMAGGRVTTNDIFAVENFLRKAALEITVSDEVEETQKIEEPIQLVQKRKKIKIRKKARVSK